MVEHFLILPVESWIKFKFVEVPKRQSGGPIDIPVKKTLHDASVT